MAKCRYCGEKAGLFRSKHKECEKKHDNGSHQIFIEVFDVLIGAKELDSQLSERLNNISDESFLTQNEYHDAISSALDTYVLGVLDKGLTTKEEESKVSELLKHLNLDQKVLDKIEALSRLVQGSIIRELTKGRIPPVRQEVVGDLPFMLQKDETLIWVYNKVVHYYKQTTKTSFTGGHIGVGVRVAKGLYLRTGAFKGNPILTSEMKYLGPGMFGLTDKHIYFYSPSGDSLRIPVKKIITINASMFDIRIQQDGARSKPQIFSGVDGWFVYNVIANLNRIH